MKRNVIQKTVAMIATVALMSVGNLFGQLSSQSVNSGIIPIKTAKIEQGLGQILAQKTQETDQQFGLAIPTGSEVLAQIMKNVVSGRIPLGLYPRELLEHRNRLVISQFIRAKNSILTPIN